MIAAGHTLDKLAIVDIGALSPARFESLLPPEDFAVLRAGMHRARTLLAGRTIWNVSSTARGGGVAEMLVSLLAYARGASVDARWAVISGNEPFFALTKRLHNRLHGFDSDGGPLGEDERRDYEATLAHSLTHERCIAVDQAIAARPGAFHPTETMNRRF